MAFEMDSDNKLGSGQKKDASAFALLIESGAIAFVRSIQIVPVNNTEMEFRCLFKTKYDMRNHLVRQVMSSCGEAYLVADALIDIQAAQNPKYSEVMEEWRKILSNTTVYTTTGISVVCTNF